MNNSCTDQTVGKLLHGYELHLLDAEEETAFELHLMECEYCCGQINAASDSVDILRNDPDLKEAVARNLPDMPEVPTAPKTSLQRWLSSGWRPMAAILLLVILAIPLYNAYRDGDSDAISPLEIISLLSYRNGSGHTFAIKPGADIALSFLCDDYTPGNEYTVRLYFQDKEIYVNTAYADFNASGISYLHLPRTSLREGTYHMTIADNNPDAPQSRREYMFVLQFTN